ncbi:hypothetical protein NIES4101_61500 [Calothrix sp. NIES-4101]|nr:hypothetical protein NIES4101_61500 [Calothrix sp. NIES-4101]
METSTVQPELTMKAELQKEHQWLAKLLGEWTYEIEVTMEQDSPSEKSTGTESVRSLDGLWIVAEGQGNMPECGAVTTIMTLGYNPQTKRYVGTWIGSMMTHLWVYDGELNADETVLTLDSEGPAMSGEGKMAKYRDLLVFKSDDYRVLTSHVLGDDGKWHGFMTAHYRRK